MSQEIKDKRDNRPGCNRFTLHELDEDDFPYLLLWMNRESHKSLGLLTRLAQDSRGVRFITGVNVEKARVSLLTVHEAGFNASKTPHVLAKGECCITQLQKSRLVKEMGDLEELMHCYIHHLIHLHRPQKLYWEIHGVDAELLKLASITGFNPCGTTRQGAYTLHEYFGAGNRH